MTRRSTIFMCLVSTGLLAAGCSKSPDPAPNSTTSASQAASDKPSAPSAPLAASTASTASATPAAASPTATSGATSAPVSDAGVPAAAANAPAADPPSPEALRKKNEIEWALKLDEIKNDPNGQWASQATASSSYNDAQGTAA